MAGNTELELIVAIPVGMMLLVIFLIAVFGTTIAFDLR